MCGINAISLICCRELNVLALKPWTNLKLPESVDKSLEQVIIFVFIGIGHCMRSSYASYSIPVIEWGHRVLVIQYWSLNGAIICWLFNYGHWLGPSYAGYSIPVIDYNHCMLVIQCLSLSTTIVCWIFNTGHWIPNKITTARVTMCDMLFSLFK